MAVSLLVVFRFAALRLFGGLSSETAFDAFFAGCSSWRILQCFQLGISQTVLVKIGAETREWSLSTPAPYLHPYYPRGDELTTQESFEPNRIVS